MLGCGICHAQPAFIYEGGSGNGYQSITINYNGSEFLLKGGQGNGYAKKKLSAQGNNYLVAGGQGNGYSFSEIASPSYYIFQGGSNHGYTLSLLTSSIDPFIYAGGSGDGYDMILNLREFTWTGAVGTGWNVVDNWNYSTIPDINRTVVVPANAINWPYLNSGTLAIGSNPNGGAFTAGRLWIQKDAQLYTRINNFIENYGQLRIDGIMEVRNSANDSFINWGDGIISIGKTGQLIFTNQ
ncbi:hypothetical protein [Portibacter marinus]|uniref:hypothetical protein n=1 Tax=Portibacter marinus TaxID=2898660 RepID=UPI001F2674A7|nr:hypothetical protein [Portibacter marinus]